MHVHLGRPESCQQFAVLQGHHVSFGVKVDVSLLTDVGEVFPGLAAVVGPDCGPESLLRLLILAVEAQDQRAIGQLVNGEEQANEYGESSFSCIGSLQVLPLSVERASMTAA